MLWDVWRRIHHAFSGELGTKVGLTFAKGHVGHASKYNQHYIVVE